nr:hypothetical protein [Tanacetum cinerariifolium]
MLRCTQGVSEDADMGQKVDEDVSAIVRKVTKVLRGSIAERFNVGKKVEVGYFMGFKEENDGVHCSGCWQQGYRLVWERGGVGGVYGERIERKASRLWVVKRLTMLSRNEGATTSAYKKSKKIKELESMRATMTIQIATSQHLKMKLSVYNYLHCLRYRSSQLTKISDREGHKIDVTRYDGRLALGRLGTLCDQPWSFHILIQLELGIRTKKAKKFIEVVTIGPPPAPPKKPDEKKPEEKRPPEKIPEAKKPEEKKLKEKIPIHPYNNHMPNLSTNGYGSYESVGGTRF